MSSMVGSAVAEVPIPVGFLDGSLGPEDDTGGGEAE
eukprot:CAMPEP_0177612980 /NCGR_PEP_ID=MMETSP0419_2-20121207/21636_1 /TAXON_ID=582737 /ORGANISM="Tetraselmis sp., Strain GSL018" /LENGTH=35 /DNA_ID= /DNA_START= /DNA_END= /DNA_ORIENTATION=